MTALPLTGSRVIISVNPRAGARSGRALAEQLNKECLDRGLDCEILTDIDEVVQRCEQYRQDEELRCLVAAGGDGTLGLYANLTAPETPLVPFPLGTENLMAKYLGIRKRPSELAHRIKNGAIRTMDAGRANGQLYLLMLGCGFDADVVRRLHATRKGHIHHLSYLKPILQSIRSYSYPEIRVSGICQGAGEGEGGIKAEEFETSASWVFVANLPRYAGGLKIVPAAVGTDGLLDVCTFRQGSLYHGLRYLSGVVMGQHKGWSDCQNRLAMKVRLESDEEVPYQIDGDPGGVLPIDIEALPGRVRLVVSKED